MTGVVIRHKVRDYETWLPAFIEHGEVRRRHGGTSHEVYRLTDDPNDLFVVCVFKDLDGARGFAADPSLPEVMHRAGVVSEPQISFCERADVADYAAALA